MAVHVHLEAVIKDKDKKTRRWHAFVHGFQPNNTLQDVLYHHDEVTNDPKHKIMKFWNSQLIESPFNKVWTVQISWKDTFTSQFLTVDHFENASGRNRD